MALGNADTTEYLDPSTSEWTEGASFPVPAWGALDCMAQVEDKLYHITSAFSVIDLSDATTEEDLSVVETRDVPQPLKSPAKCATVFIRDTKGED